MALPLRTAASSSQTAKLGIITGLVMALMMFFSATSVLAASLSRDMPSRVDPGSAFSVRLNIPDALSGEVLTVEETLPSGLVLTSWDVSGVKESKGDVERDPKRFRKKGSAYAWSVTPTGPVTISYTATAPSREGNLAFEAVWFDKSGFNRNQFTLSVAPAPAPTPPPVVSTPPAPTTPPAPAAAPTPASPPAKPPVRPKPAPANLTWLWSLILLIVLVGIAWWYYNKQKNQKK